MTFEKSDQMMPTVLWRHCLERFKKSYPEKSYTHQNQYILFFLFGQAKKKKSLLDQEEKMLAEK